MSRLHVQVRRWLPAAAQTRALHARIQRGTQTHFGLFAMRTKWCFILFILFHFFLPVGTLGSAAETLKRRRKLFKPGLQKPKRLQPESPPRLPGGSSPPPPLSWSSSFHSSSPVVPSLGAEEPQADVSVTCSTADFVVRVQPAFYGLGAEAHELTLGSSCKSNGVLRPSGAMLFTYPLTECDGAREVRLCTWLILTPTGLPQCLTFFTRSSLQGIWSTSTCSVTTPRRNASPAARGSSVSTSSVIMRGWTRCFALWKRSVCVTMCWIPATLILSCRNQSVHQLAVQPTWQTVVLRKTLKGHPTDFQINFMDGKKIK